MLDQSSPVELGAYGLFTLLMLREVLRFVREMLARRATELKGLRDELVQDMHELQKQIKDMTANANSMWSKIELTNDRHKSFLDREWPAMVASVASNTARVTAVESGIAQVKAQLPLRRNE